MSNQHPASIAARLRGVGPIGILAVGLVLSGSFAGPLVGAVLVLIWAHLSATPLAALGMRMPQRWPVVALQGATLGIALKLMTKAVVMPLLHAPPLNATYHYLVALLVTVLVSTALFALAHYPDQRWPGVQQAVITGIVFGSVFACRGELGMVIVAHAAYDLLAIVLIYMGWESRVAHLLFR